LASRIRKPGHDLGYNLRQVKNNIKDILDSGQLFGGRLSLSQRNVITEEVK